MSNFQDDLPLHLLHEFEEMAGALKRMVECPVCLEVIPSAPSGHLNITACGQKYCKTSRTCCDLPERSKTGLKVLLKKSIITIITIIYNHIIFKFTISKISMIKKLFPPPFKNFSLQSFKNFFFLASRFFPALRRTYRGYHCICYSLSNSLLKV
jgi:hypothetical protein